MSRWRRSLVSLQPGMAWPGLVTRSQVFLAAKTAIAAGLAWVGGPGVRSSQPAVLRAACCAPDRPADRIRLPLAGLPARRRGGGRGRCRAGGEPRPSPERLEHRHHHLRGPAAGLDGSPGPAGRGAGTHQRIARVPSRAGHARLRGRAYRRHLDRRGSRRDRRSAEPVRACARRRHVAGAGAAASLYGDPARCQHGHRVDVDPRASGLMAPGRDRADRHHRNGSPRTRGVPAEHPVERPGPPGTSGARPADEALRSGERIAIYTRSMARALADGSGNARPMPALSAMLAKTASATEAYTAWAASADTPADRRLLAEGDSRRRRHPRRRARPGTTTMGQRPRSMAHLRDDAGDEPADPGRGRPPSRPSRTRACLTAGTSGHRTEYESGNGGNEQRHGQRDVPVALPQMLADYAGKAPITPLAAPALPAPGNTPKPCRLRNTRTYTNQGNLRATSLP